MVIFPIRPSSEQSFGDARLGCRGKKRDERLGEQFGLFFRDEMACVGNDQGSDVLEIWLQRFSHRRNGVLPADCEEANGNFRGELFLVEFHVIDDVAAIVEGCVHSAGPRVSSHISSYITWRDRAWFVNFVLVPPPNIDVLLALCECGGQIGNHHENEVPLSLVVGKLDVVEQGDAGNSRFDQRKRLKVAGKKQSPAVRAPRTEVVSHNVQWNPESLHELMEDSRDVLGGRWRREDPRVSEAGQIGRNDLELRRQQRNQSVPGSARLRETRYQQDFFSISNSVKGNFFRFGNRIQCFRLMSLSRARLRQRGAVSFICTKAHTQGAG